MQTRWNERKKFKDIWCRISEYLEGLSNSYSNYDYSSNIHNWRGLFMLAYPVQRGAAALLIWKWRKKVSCWRKPSVSGKNHAVRIHILRSWQRHYTVCWSVYLDSCETLKFRWIACHRSISSDSSYHLQLNIFCIRKYLTYPWFHRQDKKKNHVWAVFVTVSGLCSLGNH